MDNVSGKNGGTPICGNPPLLFYHHHRPTFHSMSDLIAGKRLDELTYERQELSLLSINLDMLEQSCPLAHPRLGGSNTASLQPLGQLDVLPLEVVQRILQLMDIHTLTRMQCLNHRSNLLVTSLPQHRDIVTHAPNALRAMLGTGLATEFGIDDLHRALRSEECFQCGSFGSFLYLLSCRRCCYVCLAKAPDTLPLSREAAKYCYGLPQSIISQLPCMRSLPGRYMHDQKSLPRRYMHNYPRGNTHVRRFALVSTQAVKEAGKAFHGSEEAMQAYEAELQLLPNSMESHRQAGNASAVWLYYWRQLQAPWCQKLRDPYWIHEVLRSQYEPQRFMAAILFPTLDPSKRIGEWGISCKRCRDGPAIEDDDNDWEKVYTKRGYLAHLKQCKWSKELLASSEMDGT